jgi:flagellar hook-basal body complex protein FliE
MTPLGSIGSLLSANPTGPGSIAPARLPALPDNLSAAPASGSNFHGMLEGLVQAVDGQQTQADALTSRVLLGDSSQLHQSVIAMQEASTSLSLMVQVRNKLVESYQQLMSMQV